MYVKIGPYPLPVYQPGTLMFLRVSKKVEEDMNVFECNLGKSEPVMCLATALFLARFMCTLSAMYKDLCRKEG